MTLIGFVPKLHESCHTTIGYFYFMSHFLNISFLTRTLVQGSLSGTTISAVSIFRTFCILSMFLRNWFVHRCGAGDNMRACPQWARFRSPVGTSFLGEIFSGFFLTFKTNVRKL